MPRSASASSRARNRNRVADDGKIDVFCPQCAQQFRVPSDAIDTRLECTSCHRTFLVKTAVGKRPDPNANQRVYLMFIAAAVVVIASFILIKAGGDSEPAPKPAATAPETPKIDRYRHPRVKSVLGWVERVAAGDPFGTKNGMDMAAFQKTLAVETRLHYPTLQGDKQREVDQKIVAAFLQTEAAKLLRDLRSDSGMLQDDASATAEQGIVRVYLSPKIVKPNQPFANGEVRVDFRMADGIVLVTGCTVTQRPGAAK